MAALPETIDIEAYRGDTWTQTFRLLADSEPVDLDGASVASAARARVGATEHQLTAEITDAADGTVTIGLPPESIPYGDYDYDVEVTNGAVTTWIRGRLRVVRDVTNELP